MTATNPAAAALESSIQTTLNYITTTLLPNLLPNHPSDTRASVLYLKIKADSLSRLTSSLIPLFKTLKCDSLEEIKYANAVYDALDAYDSSVTSASESLDPSDLLTLSISLNASLLLYDFGLYKHSYYVAMRCKCKFERSGRALCDDGVDVMDSIIRHVNRLDLISEGMSGDNERLRGVEGKWNMCHDDGVEDFENDHVNTKKTDANSKLSKMAMARTMSKPSKTISSPSSSRLR